MSCGLSTEWKCSEAFDLQRAIFTADSVELADQWNQRVRPVAVALPDLVLFTVADTLLIQSCPPVARPEHFPPSS